jgi:hypothetical protein
MPAKTAERRRLEQELAEYYRCPKELVSEAADYVESGKDPAEVVEALIDCG